MSSDYLLYWKPRTLDFNLERGDGLLNHAASEQLNRVSPGDTIWVVTVRSGSLRLIGKLCVGLVTDREGASSLMNEALWEAEYHVIAKEGTAEMMTDLAIDQLAQSLRFESSTGRDRLNVADGRVNPQQLQTMRILTWQTALLLQETWEQAT
jgi:hypothetical protein